MFRDTYKVKSEKKAHSVSYISYIPSESTTKHYLMKLKGENEPILNDEIHRSL